MRGFSHSLRVLAAALLLTASTAAADGFDGRLSFGFHTLFVEGQDPSLRLTSRLRIDLDELLGKRGRLSLDVQGRRSDGGVARETLGVRELRFSYELLPSRLSVQAGRVGLHELEGLLLDGAGLQWKLGRSLDLEVAGGLRASQADPYGQPEGGRLGFGALLRASGRGRSASLGFAELRDGDGLERRFVSGSGNVLLAGSVSAYGHFTLDLGQPGASAHLTSLFAGATYRAGRFFDVAASVSSSTAIFLDPEPIDGPLVDLPDELEDPQPLPADRRFGPRLQSFSLRAQVSPIGVLSVHAHARLDRSDEPDVGGQSFGDGQSFGGGLRLKADRKDRLSFRAELLRSERGTASFWKWRAGALHRLGRLELEAAVSQRLDAADAQDSGEEAPDLRAFGAEANANFYLSRSLVLTGFYTLDARGGESVHGLFTQIGYRF